MSTPPLSFGQAASLVARREIGQRLRDRSFLVSTIITLVILGVVLMLPKFLGGDAPRVAFGGDRASAMASAAEATARQFDLDLEVSASPDEATAKRALTDGDLTAYVTGEKIFVQEDLDARLGAVLQQAHRQVEGNARLRAAGIDPAEVQAASAVPPLAVEAADPVDPMAEQRGQIAFIGSIVLYGQIIGYCMWVAFGVVEEKSSRVIELILSAVSSKALLAGKILGIGILGFLQLLLIAAFGIGLGSVTGSLEVSNDLLVPIGFVVVWFVLGYAFYSALFAATAARVSRQEELQNVIGPLNMTIMASFFATFYVNANPDSPISQVLAVVPPFSALCSPVRMARGAAPMWEIGLALGLMLAAIVVLIRVGGRVYDGAVLRMGTKVSWTDAWKAGRESAGVGA